MNFTAQIQAIIESRPDDLLVASWGEDLRHFIQQARSAGLFDKMAAFGWFSLITEGSVRMLPEGIWNISRGPFNYLADKHPQAKRFVQKFIRQYNTPPLGFTICSIPCWRGARPSSTPERRIRQPSPRP